MTLQNFIKEINREYNIDVTPNIEYTSNGAILHNNENFNFFKLFVLELQKSGLRDIDNFIPIGTSEDNNIHIVEKYYSLLSGYYAVYNESKNYITLVKTY
jgi:hypothetical protein